MRFETRFMVTERNLKDDNDNFLEFIPLNEHWPVATSSVASSGNGQRGADASGHCSNRKAHRTWPCTSIHRFIWTSHLVSLSPSISYSLRWSLVAQNLASNEVSNNCLLMTNWPHARNLVALSAARLMTRRRKDADHWPLNRGRSFLCSRLQEFFFFVSISIRSPWIEG